MRYSALATGLLALALPACATFDTVFGSGPDRFDTGIAALQRGDFAQASNDLNWVILKHPNDPIGQRALLASASLEMDPRNPQRHLALGADLAATYLQKAKEPESQALAQTLYLLALELGAAEERLAQAEADKRQAEQRAEWAQLPKLPASSTTVPARLRTLTEEKDKLAKRVETLEQQVAERDKKLDEKEKELERIRKTLKR
jgi:hypothetical protein